MRGGDFRTVSHKEMTRIIIHHSYPYMNGIMGMLCTVLDMSNFTYLSAKYFTKCLTKLFCNMTTIECLVTIHCIVF